MNGKFLAVVMCLVLVLVFAPVPAVATGGGGGGGHCGGSNCCCGGEIEVKFYFDAGDIAGRAKNSRPVRMIQAHSGPNYGIHFPLKPGISGF